MDPAKRATALALMDDGWFAEQLGGSGISDVRPLEAYIKCICSSPLLQEVFDRAVETVREWMGSEIPGYRGPSPRVHKAAAAG